MRKKLTISVVGKEKDDATSPERPFSLEKSPLLEKNLKRGRNKRTLSDEY